jgi:hypothetical protein
MIGMPTGMASGVDVLDLDLKPEEYIDGRRHVLDWKSLSSVITRTQSGGAHAWFKSEAKVQNSTDVIAPGVDTRGAGGYVIVPPSRNSAGNAYRFIEGGLDDIARLPVFPAEFLAKLGATNKGRPNADPKADPALSLSAFGRRQQRSDGASIDEVWSAHRTQLPYMQHNFPTDPAWQTFCSRKCSRESARLKSAQYARTQGKTRRRERWLEY